MPAKKIKFIAGFAVIIGCLLTLVVSSSKKMSLYYLTVTELEAKEVEFINTRIKLAGKVVPQSIIKSDGNRTVEFQIWEPIGEQPNQFSNKRTIRYSGVVPDTFRDEADVVLEGKTHSDGIFVAENMLAKCPSKYESKSYDEIKASYE
jgi:cytochrome c-type biogenesis protein CcmE